jgi:hypothetical protein
MGENNLTGSGAGGSSGTKPLKEQGGSPSHGGGRRRYAPPRLLSSEPLELAAATCNPPTGGFGKTVPLCNPATPGS